MVLRLDLESVPVLKLSDYQSQFEAMDIIQFNAKTEAHVVRLIGVPFEISGNVQTSC